MNKLIATGLVLAVLTGGALAQSAAGSPPPPTQAGAGAAPPPPPPDDAGMDEPGRGGPHGGGPRGHHPPPPPSRAAHFRLERGDAALDVKCAEDEPMRSCADIALQMLDKLQALPKP